MQLKLLFTLLLVVCLIISFGFYKRCSKSLSRETNSTECKLLTEECDFQMYDSLPNPCCKGLVCAITYDPEVGIPINYTSICVINDEKGPHI